MRCTVDLAFNSSWKAVSNQLPTGPGLVPTVDRQVYSNAMEFQTFVSYAEGKKKLADFPPKALCKVVSKPPVHILQSRKDRAAGTE